MKIYYTKNKTVRYYETDDENEIAAVQTQQRKQMYARMQENKRVEEERRQERSNGICTHCYCVLPRSGVCDCV